MSDSAAVNDSSALCASPFRRSKSSPAVGGSGAHGARDQNANADFIPDIRPDAAPDTIQVTVKAKVKVQVWSTGQVLFRVLIVIVLSAICVQHE